MAREIKQGLKFCPCCKEQKNNTEFYTNNKKKDRLSCYCKVCEKEKVKKWQSKNLSKVREATKKWKKENRDKVAYHNRSWTENNREKSCEKAKKWKMKNLEKASNIPKNWRKNNREKYLASNKNSSHRRRVNYKETDINVNFLLTLKEETKNCSICGTALNNVQHSPSQYNLDHIIPLIVGGKHSKDNVRYICRKCNLSRKRKTFLNEYKN
jgi:hypothetical protein